MIADLVDYLKYVDDYDIFITSCITLAGLIGVSVGLVCGTTSNWIVKVFVSLLLLSMSSYIMELILEERSCGTSECMSEHDDPAVHIGGGDINVIKVDEEQPVVDPTISILSENLVIPDANDENIIV